MPFLYIVRHGQAGTFTGSYDQLSPTGQQQAAALGRFWKERGLSFAAAFRGSLIRQKLTLETILGQMAPPAIGSAGSSGRAPSGGSSGSGLPVTELEGLNEFSLEMWRSVAQTLAQKDADFARLMEHLKAAHDSHSRRYFAYFRRANNRVLQAWMNDEVEGDYYRFSEFRDGVISTIEACQAAKPRLAGQTSPRSPRGGETNLLLVTSATPLILFMAHALGLQMEQAMPQFRWLYNTSVNVFHLRRKFSLVSFNSVEHLPFNLRTLI